MLQRAGGPHEGGAEAALGACASCAVSLACTLVSLTLCVLVQYNNVSLCANGRVPCLSRHRSYLLSLPNATSEALVCAVDHSAGDLVVWESGALAAACKQSAQQLLSVLTRPANAAAILMYLCEQHGGKFMGGDAKERAAMLTWIFFQMVC